MLIVLHDLQLMIFALLGGLSGFLAAKNFQG
ncbi:hypothetical protein VII00023_02069 [Vibrio ichthyoenteri ATCC 700023]|uniref:Uncharacterized protein n=1 Tax=Vibrio ichthyoenteri ATCC 700023 TaxID=870968 RepID=F9RY23_9VIBR|nr:hypothetical protein VII00023_02069 [Vibrio ichthyoenteri ATCC 700023]